MKTNKSQAPVRLFKKLTAMRAVLSKDEREVLDGIIQVEGITSEVAAHKMTTKATGKAVSKATTKASEVAAHKMTTKATGKAVSKATTKAVSKATR